jgi:hypothetical protein
LHLPVSNSAVTLSITDLPEKPFTMFWIEIIFAYYRSIAANK